MPIAPAAPLLTLDDEVVALLFRLLAHPPCDLAAREGVARRAAARDAAHAVYALARACARMWRVYTGHCAAEREDLRASMHRLWIFFAGSLVLLVMRQVLHQYWILGSVRDVSRPAFWLEVVDVVLIGMGMSGKQQLDTILLPLIRPLRCATSRPQPRLAARTEC